MSLSKNSLTLLKQRYCHPNESPRDVYKRVSNALSLGDNKFEKRLRKAMEDSYFLPNSPCIRNAGQKKSLLHACFILPIEDSTESIFDTLKNMALIFHFGGGVGINFSKLRAKDAPLSSGGASSGVISFMEVFDATTNAVKQGGFRRGALMGILNFEHAEIVDFIRCKLKDKLTNFNISVMISDKFMEKVTSNGSIELLNPQNNEVWNKINARDLFDLICFSAWNSGDPGMLFYDRINKDNKFFPKIKIKATNPCLSKDTLIRTTMGEISIGDLAKTRSKSADVFCMIDGKLAIRKATNIRATVKNPVSLLEITTTRGSLKCTPNHPIYVIGRGWIEAKDIKPHEQLVGLRECRRGAKYIGVALSTQEKNTDVMEHRLIIEHYVGKLAKYLDVHHIDGNTHNNKISNLQILPHSLHSSIRMVGNTHYNSDKNTGRFVAKEDKKQKVLINTDNKKTAWYVLAIKELEEKEIVYNMEVEEAHNFIANGVIVHNCGEVPLPEYGACCLGSINLSKFVKGNSFNHKEFAKYVELATRALLNMNAISWYPLPQITKTMKELNPIGVGIMGFADALIKLGIYYNSDEALKFIDEIAKPYIDITNKLAKDSFYKRIIAPTGSLSILADCSSSIEPVFATTFERHLTVGVIEETRDIYKSKYVRVAHEVEPEWHLKVQAKWQEKLDGACSKTINLPNEASVDDVKSIYTQAWKMGVKGITIFRDGSKEGVLKKTKPKAPKGKCDGDTCHL